MLIVIEPRPKEIEYPELSKSDISYCMMSFPEDRVTFLKPKKIRRKFFKKHNTAYTTVSLDSVTTELMDIQIPKTHREEFNSLFR